MKLQNKLSKVVLLMVVFGLVLAAGAVAGGTTGAAVAEPGIFYRLGQVDVGWNGWANDGADATTVGGKNGISVAVRVVSPAIKGGVRYQIAEPNVGWRGWSYDNEDASVSVGSHLINFKLELTGDLAKTYSVRYRVGQVDVGWNGWVEDGADATTVGGKAIINLQARLIKK
jgi:uncharacterized protein YjdB